MQAMSFQKILKKFKDAKAGILTNQSGYGGKAGWEYHFEFFKKHFDLITIFLPEHGLFAELQDQVSGSSLQYDYGNINIVNLYGDEESSLFISPKKLDGLDLVIIDIKDVGARYYTFLTTAYYLLNSVSVHNSENKSKSIDVLIIDSENPIGRKVEGSPLQKKYESFVGVETVPHRHGLSSSELLNYYQDRFQLKYKSTIIKDFYSSKSKFWVPPSPNIPTRDTCYVYTGQCLLEGTNLSEGRGTTRPFEIFGAPYIEIQNKLLKSQLNHICDDSFVLRPLYFQPTFHKHSGKICGGFQIIVLDKKKFHSLLFTLGFIRTIKDFYKDEFTFLNGPYEFRSDLSAIELLAGDDTILGYLNGKLGYKQIKEYLKESEKNWGKVIGDYI
jgi:uncharacterized protein YbbC (DUF1343 family)